MTRREAEKLVDAFGEAVEAMAAELECGDEAGYERQRDVARVAREALLSALINEAQRHGEDK